MSTEQMVSVVHQGQRSVGLVVGYAGRGESHAVVVTLRGSARREFDRVLVIAGDLTPARNCDGQRAQITAYLETPAGRELRRGVKQPKQVQPRRESPHLKPIREHGSPSYHDAPLVLAEGVTSNPTGQLCWYIVEGGEERDARRRQRDADTDYYRNQVAPNAVRFRVDLRRLCEMSRAC